MKSIIAIVGENASGKTTVTNYLKDHYHAVSFRFSDMLSDILDRVYVEKNRPHLQALSTFLRQTYGEDVMSKTIAKDVEQALREHDIVVTEGVRRPTDITYLKDMEGFTLVAIETDIKKRFARLAGRGEKADDATKTWEEFQTEAMHESELKIQEIAKTADAVIMNDGALEKLWQQIDQLMKQYEH